MTRSYEHPTLIPLPVRLEGSRVVVRPYARGDGAAVFDALEAGREELGRFLPWPSLHKSALDSEQYARKVHARWLLRDDLAVALTDLSGRLVGGSGLHNIDWQLRAFEMGYWLRTEAWGQGYVTEAAQLLTAMAFELLDARRVFIRCDATNARSAAVPRRLGYTQDAFLRANRLSIDGSASRDSLEFGLVPSDLAALPWYPAARALVLAAPLDA